MCGIAGAIALNSNRGSLAAPVDRIVARMSARLAHRGPDASGIWTSPSGLATLAHRRLAIIDLTDTGRQPMGCENRFWVTFNGEIYNFKELRTELSAAGHGFRGDSDTEVLLASVAHWGIGAALRKFVGMFAFALWDERDRVLHLARDRMGEKPLYIGEHAGYLFFGSELRAFRAIPDFHPSISAVATRTYLRDGCVSGHQSLFEGVYKLPPAHLLSVPAGTAQRLPIEWGLRPQAPRPDTLSPYPYWDCGAIARQGRQSLIHDAQEAIALGESLLRQSVKLQAHADVPTGAFLSGGIDSTLVTALMQAQSTNPVQTFTVAFDDSRFDESKHARAIADHLGTRHHEFTLTEREILDQVPSIVGWMDEPTANASFFPVYLISALARSQVTVVLAGDGGDELFAGYNRYTLAPRVWRATGWLPRHVRQRLATVIDDGSASFDLPSWIRRMAHFGSQVGSTDARRKLARILRARDFREAYEHLTAWSIEPTLMNEHTDPSPRDWPAHFDIALSSLLLTDQTNYLPDDNLAKVDRASMATSLETRLPLLDHRLVEFSWRLPDAMKIRGRATKWLLRAVLARHLPRHLYERPKMGFSVPIDRWLRGPLRDWATAMIDSTAFHDLVPLNPQRVRDVWTRYQLQSNVSANEIWAIVTLAAWANAVGTAQTASELA